MDVLALSGSSRQGSLNSRLARLVSKLRPADQVVALTDLRGLPFYDGDVEAAGTPPAVGELRAKVQQADLVVLVTPEYNGTVPGLLANALDWLSRPARQSVLLGKTVLVLSASPTAYGGARAAGHLREVLARIGADVLELGMSVPLAHERLGGQEVDSQLVDDLADLLATAAQAQQGEVLAG